jgi:ribonuclease HI
MKYLGIYNGGAAGKADSTCGGWAYVMAMDEEWWEKSGRVSKANANRLEMTALLEALEDVSGMSPKPDEVIVYFNSAYCVDRFSEGRKVGRRHKNADLLNRCLAMVSVLQQAGTTVRFKWIKKRSPDPFMDRALSIANAEVNPADAKACNILETFLE